MQEYYRAKNAENFAKGGTEFDFLDMQFNIQALDKVFGPGGVRLKTSGSMSLTLSLVTNKIDNPALAESARKKTYFDFDEKIQANINASVGTKIGFNMTYNTDATFDFDAQKMSLKYEGDEDQIIKTIEGGNISMTTGSSLIRGGTSLFGLKTTLQFGKLTVTGLVSQQETDSKTVSSEGGSQTTEFEIGVDAYDQNRHFFLAHYFRDNYDNFILRLPYITSGITINRIEIWVTNKQGSYDNARNIVAFADLGETQADNLASNHWSTTGAQYPSNTANSLYNDIIASYPDARYISRATQGVEPPRSLWHLRRRRLCQDRERPPAVVVGIYSQQPARLRPLSTASCRATRCLPWPLSTPRTDRPTRWESFRPTSPTPNRASTSRC